MLAQRQCIGQPLTGVPAGALEIDDRLVGVLREVADKPVLPLNRPVGALGEGTHGKCIGIAREDPRCIDYMLHR